MCSQHVLFWNKKPVQNIHTPLRPHEDPSAISRSQKQFYHFKQTSLENSLQNFNINIHLNFNLDFDQAQKPNQLKSYSLWLGPHLYVQI